MTRRPAPATLALEDQVLAVLRTTGPLPLSTAQVCEQAGAGHRYSDRGLVVYRRLDALAKTGRVERVRVDGHRAVYWRLTVYEPESP